MVESVQSRLRHLAVLLEETHSHTAALLREAADVIDGLGDRAAAAESRARDYEDRWNIEKARG